MTKIQTVFSFQSTTNQSANTSLNVARLFSQRSRSSVIVLPGRATTDFAMFQGFKYRLLRNTIINEHYRPLCDTQVQYDLPSLLSATTQPHTASSNSSSSSTSLEQHTYLLHLALFGFYCTPCTEHLTHRFHVFCPHGVSALLQLLIVRRSYRIIIICIAPTPLTISLSSPAVRHHQSNCFYVFCCLCYLCLPFRLAMSPVFQITHIPEPCIAYDTIIG